MKKWLNEWMNEWLNEWLSEWRFVCLFECLSTSKWNEMTIFATTITTARIIITKKNNTKAYNICTYVCMNVHTYACVHACINVCMSQWLRGVFALFLYEPWCIHMYIYMYIQYVNTMTVQNESILMQNNSIIIHGMQYRCMIIHIATA